MAVARSSVSYSPPSWVAAAAGQGRRTGDGVAKSRFVGEQSVGCGAGWAAQAVVRLMGAVEVGR